MAEPNLQNIMASLTNENIVSKKIMDDIIKEAYSIGQINNDSSVNPWYIKFPADAKLDDKYYVLNYMVLFYNKFHNKKSIIFTTETTDGTFNLKQNDYQSQPELILNIFNLPKCRLFIGGKFITNVEDRIDFNYPLNLTAIKESNIEFYDLSFGELITNFQYTGMMTSDINIYNVLSRHSSKKYQITYFGKNFIMQNNKLHDTMRYVKIQLSGCKMQKSLL